MLLLGARGENDFILVQMNLEKKLKKMEKGAGAAGPTPPPFRPSERPGLLPPPPLSRARGARPVPASVGHVAAVRRRGARRGRPPTTPLVGTSARAPRPFHPSCRPRPSPSSLRSRSAAVATPPQRHRRSSSAAHRRPLQCPNLDAETTRALAVVAVSSCECSTEVRARRAP